LIKMFCVLACNCLCYLYHLLKWLEAATFYIATSMIPALLIDNVKMLYISDQCVWCFCMCVHINKIFIFVDILLYTTLSSLLLCGAFEQSTYCSCYYVYKHLLRLTILDSWSMKTKSLVHKFLDFLTIYL